MKFKKIFQLAPHLIISNIFTLALPLSATFFIAKLGTQPLAALAIGGVTYLVFNNFVIAAISSIGLVATEIANLDYPNKLKPVIFLNYIACLYSILPALILWLLPILFNQLKWHIELLSYLADYFHYCGLCIITTAIYAVMIQFLQGYHLAKIATIFNLIKIASVIPLSYYLISNRWQLNITAIPVGLIIIQTILIISLNIYIVKFLSPLKTTINQHSFITLTRKITIIGLPLAAQAIIERSAVLAATYMIGQFGVIALAAAQLATQGTVVIAAFQSGITDAVALIISKLKLTQHKNDYDDYLFTSCLLTTLIAVISLIILLMLNTQYLEQLAMKYNHSVQMAYLTKILLIIGLAGLIMQGIKNSLCAIFNGLHQTRISMLVSSFTLWGVSITSSFGLGFIFPGGVLWLRAGLTFGYPVAIFILSYIYYKNKLLH